MRVELLSDNLYDCNYLMFQNTAYGNKWFYAFINEVNYINDVTCEIVYQLDVMQTWYFQYRPQACFVEREHTETDEPGNNIVTENLPTGEYQYTVVDFPDIFDTSPENMVICLATSEYPSTLGDRVQPQMITGVYSGVCYFWFPVSKVGTGEDTTASNIGDINKFIDDITESMASEAIVSMQMLPVGLFPYEIPIPPWSGQPIEYRDIFLEYPKQYSGLGSYTPRNKKLYTYPYNMIFAVDGNGNGYEYAYEFFTGTEARFQVKTFISAASEIELIPIDYKGISRNYVEKVTFSNFPFCSYNIDSYKAWLAQNRYSNAEKGIDFGLGIVNSAVDTIGSFFSGGPGAAVASGIKGVTNIASGISHSLFANAQGQALPAKAHGQSTNGLTIQDGFLGWAFYNCHVHPQFAKQIDDYFDRFGYACKENKVPGVSNRNMPRPHWAYIKTIGCTITGSMPADDMKEIINIYNAGITFWANGAEVGNYSLDNRPV